MLQLSLDFLGRQFERVKPVRVARTRIDRPLAWKHGITVHLVFRPRARRYLLGVRPDGAARLVIPRRGNEAEGLRFLERSEAWLLKRIEDWRSRSHARQPWVAGSRFLYRGEEVALQVETQAGRVALSFADQAMSVPHALADYREVVLRHLRRVAERELPVRTRELAVEHRIVVKRVTVRAQKTRLGFVLRARDDFAELAARSGAAFRGRLSHHPRADASAGDEPLRALLEARGGGVSRLSPGRTVAEEGRGGVARMRHAIMGPNPGKFRWDC